VSTDYYRRVEPPPDKPVEAPAISTPFGKLPTHLFIRGPIYRITWVEARSPEQLKEGESPDGVPGVDR
jgi:hypothetical protein